MRGDKLLRFDLSGLAVAIVLAFLIWHFSDIVFVVFGAILLAVALTIPIKYLSTKTGLRWNFSFLIVLALTIIFIISLVGLFYNTFSSQAAQLVQSMPRTTSELSSLISSKLGFTIPAQFLPNVDVGSASKGVLYSFKIAAGALGLAASLLLVFVMSLFFSSSPESYIEPLKREFGKQGSAFMDLAHKDLKGWIKGMFYLVLLMAAISLIALHFIGVKYALVLGIITGLMELVPLLGIMISWSIAVLVALSDGPTKALYVTIFYLILQFTENNLLMPMVQRNQVNIQPGFLLIAQLTFATLFGFIGLVFATPSFLLLRALYRAYK